MRPPHTPSHNGKRRKRRLDSVKHTHTRHGPVSSRLIETLSNVGTVIRKAASAVAVRTNYIVGCTRMYVSLSPITTASHQARERDRQRQKDGEQRRSQHAPPPADLTVASGITFSGSAMIPNPGRQRKYACTTNNRADVGTGQVRVEFATSCDRQKVLFPATDLALDASVVQTGSTGQDTTPNQPAKKEQTSKHGRCCALLDRTPLVHQQKDSNLSSSIPIHVPSSKWVGLHHHFRVD